MLEDDVAGDSDDEIHPEHVDALQGSEEGEGNILAEPAFVLLRLPIQVIWSDGAKRGED